MLALLVEYDGTEYAGWQNQPNAPTIQAVLEYAVRMIYGVSTPVVGSGRTDAGVHARGQVAHVDLPNNAHQLNQSKITSALNSKLPPDIRVRKACTLETPFHARYDAVRREYRYYITKEKSVFNQRFSWSPTLPFDPALLHEATDVFRGCFDFTTFSKLNESTASYVCNVLECSVHENSAQIEIVIAADRFVYGMCRSIVGAMMSVARGRRSTNDIRSALEARDRSLQEVLAPAQGLILTSVTYPFELFT